RGKLVLPSLEEVKQAIKEKGKVEVVSSQLPHDEIAPLFKVVELENKYGILTTQDREFLMTISDADERARKELEIIEHKVGLKIYKLKDINMVGLSGIKRFILSYKEIDDPKLKPKGIFLVGLPGTGKSFSAKYAASILGAMLVEFNISKILEGNNPVFTLHSIFKYLERTSDKNKYVIWIDEIEKMFVGSKEEKRVFGQMLTILNDMNTPTGYAINGIFWVTANNIKEIMDSNPEFLRKGRFDELFFIDNPYHDDVKEMVKYYANFYNVNYYNTISKVKTREQLADDVIMLTLNNVYYNATMETGSKDTKRFIYVPAEIQQIAKEMANRMYINQKYFQSDPKTRKDILKLLFPQSIMNNVLNYFRTFNLLKADIFSYDDFLKAIDGIHYNNIAPFHGKVSTDLNLIAVLSTNEPLSLSMKEAIAKMRAQEKIFTKGD
ncbi:MAG: ATP-binding protein, partial [Candidatus Micrarchaeaceae archaeon]